MRLQGWARFCSQLAPQCSKGGNRDDGNSMILWRKLVGASGFEPEASCAQGRRATRLRYAPTDCSQRFYCIFGFPVCRTRRAVQSALKRYELKFPPRSLKFPAPLADLWCRTALPHLRFARYGPGRRIERHLKFALSMGGGTQMMQLLFRFAVGGIMLSFFAFLADMQAKKFCGIVEPLHTTLSKSFDNEIARL
jgi:hypothetical protein